MQLYGQSYKVGLARPQVKLNFKLGRVWKHKNIMIFGERGGKLVGRILSSNPINSFYKNVLKGKI